MSGGSGGGGGGDPEPPVTCIFTFRTPLNSTVASVLALLKLSDVLDVQILVGTPPRVGAVHPTHGLAGTITAAEVTRLLACLRQGFNYDAVVIEIRPPLCRVEIRPR
jgi:hypothetical protein